MEKNLFPSLVFLTAILGFVLLTPSLTEIPELGQDPEPTTPETAGSAPEATSAPDTASEPDTTTDAPPDPLPAMEPRRPAALNGDRDRQRRPTPASKLALVFGAWNRGGWTDVLEEPHDQAPRLSQALIGDRLEVLAQTQGGHWSQVELAGQGGLTGWVDTNHLTTGSPERVRKAWDSGPMYVVVRAPGVTADGDLFLPFGATLPLVSSDDEAPRLLLPDGRAVLLRTEEVCAADQPLPLTEALSRLTDFRQVPFRNGGNTVQAMDGPGLIHLLFRAAGVVVPRDLDGLRRTGNRVLLAQAQAGDVVFFSTFNADQPRPVVLLGDGETFIEAYPARGVSFGLLEQMRNRTVLEVRRYK